MKIHVILLNIKNKKYCIQHNITHLQLYEKVHRYSICINLITNMLKSILQVVIKEIKSKLCIKYVNLESHLVSIGKEE